MELTDYIENSGLFYYLTLQSIFFKNSLYLTFYNIHVKHFYILFYIYHLTHTECTITSWSLKSWRIICENCRSKLVCVDAPLHSSTLLRFLVYFIPFCVVFCNYNIVWPLKIFVSICISILCKRFVRAYSLSTTFLYLYKLKK